MGIGSLSFKERRTIATLMADLTIAEARVRRADLVVLAMLEEGRALAVALEPEVATEKGRQILRDYRAAIGSEAEKAAEKAVEVSNGGLVVAREGEGHGSL